jgi:hypothetical protein
MMADLNEIEREETWKEIERELGKFWESPGFKGPCELVIGAGVK